VHAFGARGDGVTDDTAAIQNALDAVPATGAEVHFPSGTYVIRKTSSRHFLAFRSETRITGAGMTTATIKVAGGNGDWVDLLRSRADSRDHGSLSVSDLGFDLNTTGNPITRSPLTSGMPRMVITSVTGAAARVSITRCRFDDCSNVNTLYLAGIEVIVTDCEFIRTGQHAAIGWDHSSIYAVARAGGTIRIDGNRLAGTRSSGGSRTAIETHGGSQNVTNNLISDYLTGMNITGIADEVTTRVDVASNTIQGAMIAFHLWSRPYGALTAAVGGLRHVNLHSNIATIDSDAWRDTLGASGSYGCGFLLDPGADSPMSFVTIQDNVVRFDPSKAVIGSPLERLACGVTLSGRSEVRDLAIIGNTFDGCLSAGLLIASSVNQASIRGNHFVDAASSPVLPPDPTLRSILVLGGKVTGLDVRGNEAVDSHAGRRLDQFVGSQPGLVLDHSTIRNNTVRRAVAGNAVPELDALTERLLS